MIGLGHSHSISLAASSPLKPPFAGPVDEFSVNLAGAWSVVRRLLTVYTGALIRVRRDSDDEEMDIYPGVAGWLDVTALLDFCGDASGFLKIIYDQNAAHGHDQLQNVALNQLRIVNAGVLEVGDNGKAMARAVSSGQFMNSDAPLIETNATVLAVVNGLGSSARFAGSGNEWGQNQLGYLDPHYFVDAIFAGQSSGVAGSATAVVAWKQSGATNRRWQMDGGMEVPDNTGTLSANCGVSGWFCMNTNTGGPIGFGTGKMSELITFSATLSEADVQTLQASQGGAELSLRLPISSRFVRPRSEAPPVNTLLTRLGFAGPLQQQCTLAHEKQADLHDMITSTPPTSS